MVVKDHHLEKLFRQLRLHDGYAAFKEQLEDPSFSDKPFDERVAYILERQLKGRSERKVASLYKKSGIDDLMPSQERVDFAPERGLSKSQVKDLCQCHWIVRQQPGWIAICGATGTGKTFLAKTFLAEALKRQIPGLFKTAAALVEEFQEAHRVGTLEQIRKSYAKWQLIVLDDFVLRGASEEVLMDIKMLLDTSYRKRSIIFTSQYPLDEWYGYMGGYGDLQDAIMDRILNNTYPLLLKGRSMREKQPPVNLFDHGGKDEK